MAGQEAAKWTDELPVCRRFLCQPTYGRKKTPESSWDLMQKYGQGAEIPKSKRRFHALRHAIAVHLLDAGADVAFVQDRLGHANIHNTMVYMRYTTVTRDAQTRQLFASHRVV